MNLWVAASPCIEQCQTSPCGLENLCELASTSGPHSGCLVFCCDLLLEDYPPTSQAIKASSRTCCALFFSNEGAQEGRWQSHLERDLVSLTHAMNLLQVQLNHTELAIRVAWLRVAPPRKEMKPLKKQRRTSSGRLQRLLRFRECVLELCRAFHIFHALGRPHLVGLR